MILIGFSFLLALTAFVSVNCWALFGSFFNQYINKYEKTFNIAMALLLVYSALMITGVI
jgi:threonine/homoserine/homoserine lactone efflux protein